MHYITLDTNTWIYLANGTEPARILNYIDQEVEKGNITILLPRVIINEWNKNKEFAVKKGGLKHYKDVSESLEKIVKLLGNDAKGELFNFLVSEKTEKDDLNELIKKFRAKRSYIEEVINENIQVIDGLFKSKTTIIIDTHDEILLKAAEFALEKKAPFHSRNSFADAVIFFCFIDYAIKNQIEGAWFITYNTVDFCEKNDDRKKIHSDLSEFLNNAKAKFYTIVGEAISTIEKDIITQKELDYIKQRQQDAERRIYFCEPCSEFNNRKNEVYFKNIELIDERSNIRDPDQLAFDYASPHNSNYPRPMYTNVKVGNCSWCSCEHFICSKCNSLNAMWEGEFNSNKACEGCGLIYFIDTSSDYENLGENYIYRIPSDSPICESCGGEFEPMSNGNNICQKCEDNYLQN